MAKDFTDYEWTCQSTEACSKVCGKEGTAKAIIKKKQQCREACTFLTNALMEIKKLRSTGLLGLKPINYMKVIKAAYHLCTTHQGYHNPNTKLRPTRKWLVRKMKKVKGKKWNYQRKWGLIKKLTANQRYSCLSVQCMSSHTA